jgi:hypothetical protein
VIGRYAKQWLKHRVPCRTGNYNYIYCSLLVPHCRCRGAAELPTRLAREPPYLDSVACGPGPGARPLDPRRSSPIRLRRASAVSAGWTILARSPPFCLALHPISGDLGAECFPCCRVHGGVSAGARAYSRLALRAPRFPAEGPRPPPLASPLHPMLLPAPFRLGRSLPSSHLPSQPCGLALLIILAA